MTLCTDSLTDPSGILVWTISGSEIIERPLFGEGCAGRAVRGGQRARHAACRDQLHCDPGPERRVNLDFHSDTSDWYRSDVDVDAGTVIARPNRDRHCLFKIR